MKELEKKVIIWAKNKNLLTKDNAKNQYIKSVEEHAEIGRAILKNDLHGIIDGIGDTLVTLIILANQHNTDLETCLQIAWDEIKDRKGQTINGTFIKNI
jgi:NTP pyrophosphatase (non-canonical NTP hydrolase)